MANYSILKQQMNINKISATELSEILGITRQALYLKMNKERAFKLSEIEKIAEVFSLSEKDIVSIFF